MHLFLVLMLASDCSQYVYGAYATRARACEAVERCEQFEKVWQYNAWHEVRQPSQTVELRSSLLGKPQGTIETGPRLNLCIVQRVGLDVDDQVSDEVCP